MGTQLLIPQAGANVSTSEPQFNGHTGKILQWLISVVNLMNIDSPKTQVSELDCGGCLINWGGNPTHCECHGWFLWAGTLQRAEGTVIGFCFLTVNERWPAASSSCCCNFTAMTDSDLDPWSRVKLFPWSCFHEDATWGETKTGPSQENTHLLFVLSACFLANSQDTCHFYVWEVKHEWKQWSEGAMILCF